MESVYNQVKGFLANPESLDDFFESEALVWIDWREYDEDIVAYFNEMMVDKLDIQMVDNGQSYGDDIVLKKGEAELQIPYEENMDRDTTIKYLNDFIKPQYEIRWFVESMGNDTLGFILLAADEWKELEAEFGPAKLHYYFAPIGFESKMFDLDMEEVSDLLDLRSKNENTDFTILADWVKIATKEKELKMQKENGKIDLAYYAEAKKMITRLKDEFMQNHQDIKF